MAEIKEKLLGYLLFMQALTIIYLTYVYPVTLVFGNKPLFNGYWLFTFVTTLFLMFVTFNSYSKYIPLVDENFNLIVKPQKIFSM